MTKNKGAPSKEITDQAVNNFLSTIRDIVLYEDDRDADSNRFGFFFTMFEQPGKRWWRILMENRLIWVHNDNQRIFKMYSSMFGFRYMDGHISMMICPNVADEVRDDLRKNPKTGWTSGDVLVTIPIPDSGYSTVRAVPFDKFNMQKAPDFNAKYIAEKQAILESKAKELFEMKAYGPLKDVTDVLESEWMTIEGT